MGLETTTLRVRPKKLTHAHQRDPVAQWLEHPTRTRKVVGSNPIWSSEFSEFLLVFNIIHFKLIYFFIVAYY